VDEQCLKTIQARVLPALLQKRHINRNIPTAIRHGPELFGGLALYDLQTEAGLESIKFLRDSIYSDTAAGRLILTNLHDSQREAGIPSPLLETPDLHISHLTPTWVTSVSQYLACHNITITVNNDGSQPLVSGDAHIMQAQHLQRYTPIQQRDLNLVRLYLQVYSLQDLIDSTDHRRIDLNYWDGKRPTQMTVDSNWPRQASPTKAQRKLWSRFITSSFLRYSSYWHNPPPDPVLVPPNLEENKAEQESLTLRGMIKKLPWTERRMVESMSQLADMEAVNAAFSSKKTITIASDGGLKGTNGTFGWVIAKKSTLLYQGYGPVDGSPDTSSSTRCELW
jgi:hypothetical protein